MSQVTLIIPDWMGWMLITLCVLTAVGNLLEVARIVLQRRQHRQLAERLTRLTEVQAREFFAGAYRDEAKR